MLWVGHVLIFGVMPLVIVIAFTGLSGSPAIGLAVGGFVLGGGIILGKLLARS